MATKMISVKFDEKFLKEMDAFLKDANYANRTEFLRDAARAKMLSVEEKIQLLKSLKGSYKGPKVTWEEYRKMRESFD